MKEFLIFVLTLEHYRLEVWAGPVCFWFSLVVASLFALILLLAAVSR